MRDRRWQAAKILLVIILGLASRKMDIMPLWIGDALWALMVYYLVGFIRPQERSKSLALIAIAFCWAIEISQLYHATWIDQIRSTLPGRLVLGQGFLWSDLVAYAVGVGAGVLTELKAKGYTRG